LRDARILTNARPPSERRTRGHTDVREQGEATVIAARARYLAPPTPASNQIIVLEARTMRFMSIVISGLMLPLTARSQPVLPVRSLARGVVQLTHAKDAFAKAPVYTLGASPIAVAGGVDAPDWDLTSVSGVVLRPDGRLVTLSQVGNRFFRFAPDGRGERVLARRGAGPGDIMAPSGPVAAAGDTVILIDRANNRINWFNVMTGGVRTTTLPPQRRNSIDIMGVLRSGVLVGSTTVVGDHAADGVIRQPTPVMLMSPTTGTLRIVDSIPGLELVGQRTNYRGRTSIETRVLRFTRYAHVRAWDTLVVTGSGEGYRFDVRDAAGVIRAQVRVPIARRVVTTAMREAALAVVLKRFDGPKSEGFVDKAESIRLERATPSAESLPPYGGFHVAPDRTLWIVDSRAPTDAGGAATAFRLVRR
jgi:hypothetical protein